MNLGQFTAKLDKFTNKVIENVKQAQMNTAFDIQQDMYNNAPVNTGAYRESIMVYEQQVSPDSISVEIGTDYKVQAKDGSTYLLGYLLESGTRPHAIPNAFGFGENFGTEPDFHPGTLAQPHILPALNKNVRNYKDRIRNAIKEAKK